MVVDTIGGLSRFWGGVAECAVCAAFEFHPVVADGDDHFGGGFCFGGGVGFVNDALRMMVGVAC